MASNQQVHPVERGKTYYGPSQTIDTSNYERVDLEGYEAEFKDIDPSTKAVLSHIPVKARLMRNTSTVTLFKGMTVTSEDGYEFKRFDGLSRITGEECAGVIDDQLGPSGVRNGDMCWVIYSGPQQVYTPLAGTSFTADWEVGDWLYAMTAAAATGNTAGATSGDEGGHLVRWVGTFSAAETTNGGAAKIINNRVAVVLSAATTANTLTLKRVDVRCR